MNIGEKIKERRKELGMTVDDLAKRLHKNRATIYRYEKGDIENLPINILEPLANALHTTPLYLLGWGDKHREPKNDPSQNGDLTLGDVIKALRIHHNMTQEQCSTQIGIPLKDLQKYEDGSKQVSRSIINAIANFFGLQAGDMANRVLYSEEYKTVTLSLEKEHVERMRNWYKEFGYFPFTEEETKQIFQFSRFIIWSRDNKPEQNQNNNFRPGDY